MRTVRPSRDAVPKPEGDPSRHLGRLELERRLETLTPPKDVGKLALIVVRRENGQPLSLLGDNFLVELDLSLGNLPTGSRLRLGEAVLQVTPEPHTGCAKFRQRFGKDALRLTADPRFRNQRLRGIYAKVVRSGEVTRGDPIEVVSRG
jgi:MOSC domain-containing protein YiiM